IANGIKYLFALGSSIPLALSALVVLFTPMSRDCHACLLKAISSKASGESYSIDGFRPLFNSEAEAGKYSQ
ncbi:MAG: hypothetical protein PVG51_15500, partial [Desulfosarcina sp.]